MPDSRRIMGHWRIRHEDELPILKALETDSDRAAALTTAAIVEKRLDDVIAAIFRDDPEVKDRVIGLYGTSGTFDAKINLAYLLKVFGRVAFQDLKIIREVRNAFAHRLDIIDFSSEFAKSRCSNLKIIENYVFGPPLTYDDNMPNGAIIWDDPQEILGNPRHRYVATCGILSICLYTDASIRETTVWQIAGDEIISGVRRYPLP